MSTHTVTEIIDGDTFKVSPNWNWRGQTGDRVRPTGYDAPELGTPGGATAKTQLQNLILNKQVTLTNAVNLDRGRIVCEVQVHGRNLADFFPRYKT